ncbi:hypothetical protein E4U54_003561 [Claviceps lovelessii]|nr:hypothetical protein E4U54_003561 [Claviceps lovelessii]
MTTRWNDSKQNFGLRGATSQEKGRAVDVILPTEPHAALESWTKNGPGMDQGRSGFGKFKSWWQTAHAATPPRRHAARNSEQQSWD